MSSAAPSGPTYINGDPSQQPLVFEIWGPIARADMTGLCDRVCSLLHASGADAALVDVATVPADAVTVDALARLQLAARRLGCRMHLRGASEDLRRLVDFMGLQDVLVRTPAAAEGRTAGRSSPSRGRT